jgi:hypothetical protein
MRSPRIVMALVWVVGVLGLAATSLAAAALAPRADGIAQAAPASRPALEPILRPAQQGVNASGIVTSGQGTCFPDAVLLDCDGNVIRQLKGPAGSGFFAPYYNQWVDLNGAEAQCVAGDTYLNVVTINSVQNPCGGANQQPTNTPQPPPPPGMTATPIPAPPGAITGNLAAGRPIYASSTQATFPPEYAVDGNMATWWASLPGRDPFLAAQNRQWIYVDLGSPQKVQSMSIHWGDVRHARGYGVYVWGDWCRGWCHLGSTNVGDGGLDEWRSADGSTIEGQNFMLYLVNPYYMGGHYEIKEWEFYGSGAAPASATNVSAGKVATALTQEAGFPSSNATDGDVNTEWRTTVGGVPTWLYADLGTTMEVDRAILRWTAGMHATNYTLYAWDGRNWTAIHTQRNGVGGDETASFWAVRTRYVLLYANAGVTNQIGLREFEIYERASSGGGGGGGGVTPPPSPPRPPVPFLLEGSAGLSGPAIHGRPMIQPQGSDAPLGFGQIRADLDVFGTRVLDEVGVLGLPLPEVVGGPTQ